MADERQPLIASTIAVRDRGLAKIRQGEDGGSSVYSHITDDELKLADASIGERLAYNDYTTIDWLHDLAGCLGQEVF